MNSRRNSKRCIANISRFFTKNSFQEFLLRTELGFTFRGNLTDQNIVRLNIRTHPNDATFIQIPQSIFTYVGNITSDFFLTLLGISSFNLKLFDMHRSINIIFNEFFTDDNSIFKVVATP